MRNVTLIEPTDATVNRISGVYDLGDLYRYSMQAVFTGNTLAGNLKLQGSNDNANWGDITGSAQAVAGGQSHLWDVQAAGYRYVRGVWDHTGGTGDISMTIHVKELPGV